MSKYEVTFCVSTYYRIPIRGQNEQDAIDNAFEELESSMGTDMETKYRDAASEEDVEFVHAEEIAEE